ncbi:hypothetical protein V2I84_05360 [Pseudomonas viridiflava]|uniref:hypothetical protein n=1 Tax=Pseudomonas viridiflava TaxID=33069 RepID=UPI002EA532D1|nr:hypothetical protein [Pseudomonas viridiflava]MEE3980882.1 hypothetical protein [Pseudomonas viridiflava]MEE3989616.1 hypothetical protein [Pseudomonas viridiflava]MEE4028162.1 hypothetical protein [Pseudomonas viridiflava]MEE4034326.1 hypothetical protein [Pseudomonas viridiflava]
MMTTELSAIQRNSIESNRLAAAMAEYQRRGGQVRQVGVFEFSPKPPRREWVDPETVLRRKPPVMSRRDRKTLRMMAEGL